MNFETEKAWMVRDDGVAFDCVCHIYGCQDDIEETLCAAQWLYMHTKSEHTKMKCLKIFQNLRCFAVKTQKFRQVNFIKKADQARLSQCFITAKRTYLILN